MRPSWSSQPGWTRSCPRTPCRRYPNAATSSPAAPRPSGRVGAGPLWISRFPTTRRAGSCSSESQRCGLLAPQTRGLGVVRGTRSAQPCRTHWPTSPGPSCSWVQHSSRPAERPAVRVRETRGMTKTVVLIAGALAGAAALYRSTMRRPILNWGATPAEAEGRLPGDELLEEADGIATRAITINAPPAAVWPWIAQMGPAPRGGAYTYDWIENLLGLNMHSVDEVLPEFQHPKVGDGFGYGPNQMSFRRVESEHVL